MAHQLPPLPYDFSALEPHIDTQTMQIHHGKHHATYVTNLNGALEKHAALQSKSVDDLLRNLSEVPEDIRTAVRNNGGGHMNHTMFWQIMGPKAGGAPSGALADAIKSSLGGFDAFKEQFTKAGVGRFGSGWAWLINTGGKLSIESTPNQDNPIMEGRQFLAWMCGNTPTTSNIRTGEPTTSLPTASSFCGKIRALFRGGSRTGR